MNPFLITDGYKTGHHKMYPKNTTLVYSNFTPRHGKHTNIKDGKGVISFGQQMVMKQIKEMFDKDFFKLNLNLRKHLDSKELLNVKNEVCQEIKKEYSMYLNTDYDVSHIEALWDLGYLPLTVKALQEGTFVPYGVPVLTIVNTKPEFFWLTNFLETMISNMLWMPMTAATTAYHYKSILSKACLKTDAESIDFVDFQGHNFGMRGMGGLDATIYAGLGHDTSFKGDDGLPSIFAARKYYGEKGFIVGSVNATEHSVMCAGGDKNELDTFRYLMKQFPTGILSIVSDTWNLWDVLTKFLPELKEEILKRDGKIVIRPDSGDPVDIICGINSNPNLCGTVTEFSQLNNHGLEGTKKRRFESAEIAKEEFKGVIELLWDLFGGTTNAQGYKVLDSHIGAIYGDSITPQRAQDICDRLEAKGFASTNIVLGIGSFTYQYVTRDTHGFAMKATYIELKGNRINNGQVSLGKDYIVENKKFYEIINREIFKDPITDDGGKKSAKGLLCVANGVENYELIDQVPWTDSYPNEPSEDCGSLMIIFKNGKFYNKTTLTEIRERLNKL